MSDALAVKRTFNKSISSRAGRTIASWKSKSTSEYYFQTGQTAFFSLMEESQSNWPTTRSLCGMGPNQTLSLGLCCWQFGYSADTVAQWTLVRENPWDWCHVSPLSLPSWSSPLYVSPGGTGKRGWLTSIMIGTRDTKIREDTDPAHTGRSGSQVAK